MLPSAENPDPDPTSEGLSVKTPELAVPQDRAKFSSPGFGALFSSSKRLDCKEGNPLTHQRFRRKLRG